MDKVEVENVIRPGSRRSVDAVKYHAVREAYLAVLPCGPPGLTPAELLVLLAPHLHTHRFPEPDKIGWWAKTVQLDLEAKGIAVRSLKPPVRLWTNV